MVKTNVRVIARTRPTDAFSSSVRVLDDNKTFHLHTDKRSSTDVVNNTNEDHTFKLDGILRDASQEMVYEVAAADLVKSTMAGYNGTLMCYGQTGAGKTFTLMGGADYRTRGCVPRCVKAIFDEAQTQADKMVEISVTFIEIYQDRIRDLLNPSSEEDYQIMEDARGSVSIRNAEQRVCAKESDALALLFEGNSNRQTAEHSLNATSSRSHVIFTIHVQSKSRVESESASITSKLHCVDLAGSERLSKTQSQGQTAKEAQYINKSLTFLEQVVLALSSSTRSHVPFRQSKLTNVLKDSLGGNSKTTMIANLWPEERNLDETLSTLKFAVRMMRVQTDPTINAVMDPTTQLKLLQRTITELKAELHMQNQLAGKSHVQYEGEFGEDERFELEKVVKAYVGGALQQVPVKSLREVKEYFRIFKAIIDQKDAELRSVGAAGFTGVPGSPGTAGGAAAAAAGGRVGGVAAGGVGTVDRQSGLSVGVGAPSKQLKDVLKAQPPSSTAAGGRGESMANASAAYASMERARSMDGDGVGAAGGINVTVDIPDKGQAFLDFKRGPGMKLAQFIKSTQEELLAKKRRVAELGRVINQLKGEIDAASTELTRLRTDRMSRGEDDVVDDREQQLLAAIRAAKQQYRQEYDALTREKDERDLAARGVDAAKKRLVEDYDAWYLQQCEAAGVSVARGGTTGFNRSPHRAAHSNDDDLDEGERFEALELNRVLEDDPESVAFYSAKKQAATRNAASNLGGSNTATRNVPFPRSRK